MVFQSITLALCSWLFLALLAAVCYWSWQVPAARQGGWWKVLSMPGPAERRARALLREMLSPAEYEQWERCGYLEIQSPTQVQRIYRIPGAGGRVRMYERGINTAELCLQPTEPRPASDLVLLHKLLIESDEQDYLARANRFAVSSVLGMRRVG